MEKRTITPDEHTKSIPVSKKKRGGKQKKREENKGVNFVNIQLYDDSLFHIAMRQIQVSAKQILGSRKNQQDSFAASSGVSEVASNHSRAWAVVCDGMGGLASGELASQTAVQIMSQILNNTLPEDDIYSVLTQAVSIANAEVKKISQGEEAGAGTTLVAVVIDNDEMYYASVGDSRIYICRGGEFLQITRDHNYFLELTEKVKLGEITEEEALSDSQKEALISFIGIENLTLADLNQVALKLEDGDIILLCSDGLTKILNDDEIHEIIKNTNYEIEQSIDDLLYEVQVGRSSGLDNTTIAMLKYNKF